MLETFASLLKPVEIEEFFATYWEARPLLVGGRDAAIYADLINSADLDAILSRGDARYPAVRLAKGGGFYPPEAYTGSYKYGDEVFSGVIDVDRVAAAYRSGATIVLPSLHRTWRPVGLLCAGLEAEFGHLVHANAYLAPAGVQGFTPHYDNHDAIVLQIAGRKEWRVYPPVLPLPHRSQVFSPQTYVAPAPLMELTLTPGDLLYLPRGYVHSAATSDSFSAHVTVGITVYTLIELAVDLVLSAKSNVEFRKALPTGFATGARRADLEAGLKALLDHLRENADYDGLIDRFTARVRSGHATIGAAFNSDVTARPTK